MKAPQHIANWFSERLERMPAARRAIAVAGVRDFNVHDWEAFFQLHRTYRISTRTEEELAELAMEEQRILSKLPPIVSNGVTYSAPWSWGVAMRAAANLWGDPDDFLTRNSARPLSEAVLA